MTHMEQHLCFSEINLTIIGHTIIHLESLQHLEISVLQGNDMAKQLLFSCNSAHLTHFSEYKTNIKLKSLPEITPIQI